MSKVLNVTNNTILETTYEFLSDHIIIMTAVQNRLKIDRLEIEYTVLLNTLTVKQLTTSLCLISDSAMLHPLKRSENHSSKLIRAESLKARKWFLMVITPV